VRTPLVGTVWARICFILFVALAGGIGCRLLEQNVPSPATGPLLPGQTADVFTTARPTIGAALNDFLGRHPVEVEQPFEFPHIIHVGRGIACTEYCHESVSEGPVAGLPSVRTCMACHRTVATNRPRIRQITQMREQGRDFAWKRVFGYPAQSHVRFNHAPHIRAKVECSTCHGNIGAQRVAQRNVNLTMGVCVSCHRERKAPDDCLTCHF
jgi:hypothetical protein